MFSAPMTLAGALGGRLGNDPVSGIAARLRAGNGGAKILDNNTLLGFISLPDGAQGAASQTLYGFAPTHKLLTIAASFARHRRAGKTGPFFVVTPGPAQADSWRRQLASLLPGENVLIFPAKEVWAYEPLHIGDGVYEARLAVLQALLLGEPACIVVPVQALAEKLAPAAVLREQMTTLARGMQYPLHEL